MRASPPSSIDGSTGTTAAPALTMPNAAIPQSGWFAATSTTVSPCLIPAACRRAIAAIERALTSANVTRLKPSASRRPIATRSACRSAMASTRSTSVGCARSGLTSRRSFLSISGITQRSKAGSCTFIIQSAKSSFSGSQRSFFLSTGDRRACAARVLAAENGPLNSAVNGSNRRRSVAIFSSPSPTLSSAPAIPLSAGTLRASFARPRAPLAIAGELIISNCCGVTKTGSRCACTMLSSGLPPDFFWKCCRL